MSASPEHEHWGREVVPVPHLVKIGRTNDRSSCGGTTEVSTVPQLSTKVDSEAPPAVLKTSNMCCKRHFNFWSAVHAAIRRVLRASSLVLKPDKSTRVVHSSKAMHALFFFASQVQNPVSTEAWSRAHDIDTEFAGTAALYDCKSVVKLSFKTQMVDNSESSDLPSCAPINSTQELDPAATASIWNLFADLCAFLHKVCLTFFVKM